MSPSPSNINFIITGTIGLEILKQSSATLPDAIFVCVGGGGLIAGIATVIKSLRPDVKVYGVEAEDACAMYKSFEAGHRVVLKDVGLFADGAAVKQVRSHEYRIYFPKSNV